MHYPTQKISPKSRPHLIPNMFPHFAPVCGIIRSRAAGSPRHSGCYGGWKAEAMPHPHDCDDMDDPLTVAEWLALFLAWLLLWPLLWWRMRERKP
jgi:hypothetical protein